MSDLEIEVAYISLNYLSFNLFYSSVHLLFIDCLFFALFIHFVSFGHWLACLIVYVSKNMYASLCLFNVINIFMYFHKPKWIIYIFMNWHNISFLIH